MMVLGELYESLKRGKMSTLVLGDPSIRFELAEALLSTGGPVIYLDLSSFLTHLSIQGYIEPKGIIALNPGREGLNRAIAEVCSIEEELEAMVFDSLPAFYYMDRYDVGERNRLLGVYLMLLKKLSKTAGSKLIVYTFPKPYGGLVGGRLIERLSDTIASVKKREGRISIGFLKPKHHVLR